MANIKKAAIASLALRRLNGESIESIASEIVHISYAMRVLRSTRLNEDTLLLLIQNAIGANQATKYKAVPMKTIKAVLDAVAALEEKHLKPKEKK